MVTKVENVDPKVPKQAEAKRDGAINPQNYNFNYFKLNCLHITFKGFSSGKITLLDREKNNIPV